MFFPGAKRVGRRGSCVPFVSPFHPFPLFLAPEKYPGRVSATLPRKSNVKRSVRLIERLPASGKSAFPGFSYRTKRWPRSTALKRERRFQAARKLKRKRAGECMRVHHLASYLRTEGEERKGRVFEPTCRGFSPNAASFVFPSFLFKALLNLSHGLSTIVHPGIDLLCRLHLNKGWNAQWNESSTFVSCFPSYFSFFLFQILIVIFLINKINNIIVQFTWKSSLNYIFKRGNVSIKTAWALTLSIIERHRKRYSLEMWYDVYIYIYMVLLRERKLVSDSVISGIRDEEF